MRLCIELIVMLCGFLAQSSAVSIGDEFVPQDSSAPSANMSHHPLVDLKHWLAKFPIEKLRDEREAEYRNLEYWKDRPRAELRELSCPIMTTPEDLALLEQLRDEQVRPQVAANPDRWRVIPSDLFLWRETPHSEPWLTQIGGQPYRSKSTPWPKSKAGAPLTFIAQLSFVDSQDIVPFKLPGDVLLIFFSDPERSEVHLEWIKKGAGEALTIDDCPAPSFPVPKLFGVRCRIQEYEEQIEGDNADYIIDSEAEPPPGNLFVSQATKIGVAPYLIQGYHEHPELTPIAVLNSLELIGLHESRRQPLVDRDSLPVQKHRPEEPYGWGAYEMMFDDVGSVYIYANETGETSWSCDSY